MIHKRAYYRGLLKVADIRPAPMPSYVQVGRGTRRRAPIAPVKVGDKSLTYGDIGINDLGAYSPNFNHYDDPASGTQKQQASLLLFVTDKNLAGKLHIDRKYLQQAMKTHMPRIRGGNIPLSQLQVSAADFGAVLNQAYKLQHTGKNYLSDSGIVNDLTYQYGKYKNQGSAYKPLQQPAGTQTPAPQSLTIPTSVSNIPQAPTKKPTGTESIAQGEKANKTPVATADPSSQRPVQTTVKLPDMGSDYGNEYLQQVANRIATTKHLLSQDYYRNVNRALMAGSNLVQPLFGDSNTYQGKAVTGFLVDRGFRNTFYDDFGRQRLYYYQYDYLAKALGFMDSYGDWNTSTGGRAAFHRWLQQWYTQMQQNNGSN